MSAAEALAPEQSASEAVSYTHLDVYKRQVWHMAITHTNQANREKELKADGTISSERHAD